MAVSFWQPDCWTITKILLDEDVGVIVADKPVISTGPAPTPPGGNEEQEDRPQDDGPPSKNDSPNKGMIAE